MQPAGRAKTRVVLGRSRLLPKNRASDCLRRRDCGRPAAGLAATHADGTVATSQGPVASATRMTSAGGCAGRDVQRDVAHDVLAAGFIDALADRYIVDEVRIDGSEIPAHAIMVTVAVIDHAFT